MSEDKHRIDHSGMIEWLKDVVGPDFDQCPQCGVLTDMAKHSPEKCAFGQKLRAERLALMELASGKATTTILRLTADLNKRVLSESRKSRETALSPCPSKSTMSKWMDKGWSYGRLEVLFTKMRDWYAENGKPIRNQDATFNRWMANEKESPDNTDQFGRPIEIIDDDYDEPPQRTYVPPSPPPHTNGASYDDEIPFD
jgi:hypothetical protein